MVCIYCGGHTSVANSRSQRRANQIWRRRQCAVCGGIFTTEETAKLSGGLMVEHRSGELRPFDRDNLFVSIHDSCKHRPTALTDATALTQTVLARLIAGQQHEHGGIVARDELARLTHEVLGRFDVAAATVYTAYHPLAL